MAGSSDDNAHEGPPPRPSPPRRPRESIVIEGQAAPANARRAAFTLPARGARAPITAGLVGGALGAVLTGLLLLAPRPDYAARIETLESAAKANALAAQALGERLKAAEAAFAAAQLEPRVTALEAAEKAATADRSALADRLSMATAASADLPQRISRLEARPSADGLDKVKSNLAAQADAMARLQGAMPDRLAADALAGRVAALEAERSPASAAQAARQAADPRLARLAADLARVDSAAATQRAEFDALRDRFAKAEAAPFAPKSATRAGRAEAGEARDAPAPRAIAALALQDRLAAGARLGDEIAALERLGVEPAALEPLRAYAERGAPSLSELTLAFGDLAPRLTGPASARLWQGMQGLVQVRKLGESHPAEATGGVHQVEAALAHGDLEAALAAMPPPAAQDAAGAWRQTVATRLAATKAASALLRSAIADLGAR